MNNEKPVKCGCGGEAKVIKTPTRWAVGCLKCDICTGLYDTEAEAVEVWNTAMGERTAKVEVHLHPCGVSGKCLACGGDVYNEDPYCSHCGCRLEWE